MADDDAYASFLDKANQSTSSPSTQNIKTTSSRRSNATIPQQLQDLSASTIIYQSDTDSAFEALALKSPPSVESEGSVELSKSVVQEALREAGWGGKTGKVDAEEMSVEEWDPKGVYAEVVSGVGEVVKGGKDGVRVYRVDGKGARVEYFVLGVAEGSADVVGVWVEAVES